MTKIADSSCCSNVFVVLIYVVCRTTQAFIRSLENSEVEPIKNEIYGLVHHVEHFFRDVQIACCIPCLRTVQRS